MNKYETVIILNPDITKEQTNNVITKVENYIKNNGKITSTNTMGTKKLAYTIKKHTHGYYYIIEFESDSTAIYELQRIYRITDEIIKFITIKKDN